MTTETREATILERVRQELLAEGYDVVLHPNKLMVPQFLEGHSPDALAFGRDRNLVVEVASQNPRSEKRIADLSRRVAKEPSWDLRLIWSSAGSAPRSLQVPDPETLNETLNEIDALLGLRRPKAAFLLAWAALEAVARTLMPEEVAKPQTPLRLIERLAREAYVTPAEAETLRSLVSRRNRLIHGELQTEIRRKHVGEMLTILQRVISAETSNSSSRTQTP